MFKVILDLAVSLLDLMNAIRYLFVGESVIIFTHLDEDISIIFKRPDVLNREIRLRGFFEQWQVSILGIVLIV